MKRMRHGRKKTVGCKWACTVPVKFKPSGKIERYETSLGFTQIKGIDYDETRGKSSISILLSFLLYDRSDKGSLGCTGIMAMGKWKSIVMLIGLVQ